MCAPAPVSLVAKSGMAAECAEDLPRAAALPDSREASTVSSLADSPLPAACDNGNESSEATQERTIQSSTADADAEDVLPSMLEALTDECFLTFFNAFLALPVRLQPCALMFCLVVVLVPVSAHPKRSTGFPTAPALQQLSARLCG
jgi:hypothetical protein